MKNKLLGKIKQILHTLYLKLFKINDTPQRVALGFGLGVFTGIFPGTGPIAALVLAFILRVNRAAALIGCLLTNTWISFVAFFLAIQAGALIFGIKWQEIQQDWATFSKTFDWSTFFKLSVLEIFLPILIGFIVIGLFFGLIAYLILLLILKNRN